MEHGLNLKNSRKGLFSAILLASILCAQNNSYAVEWEELKGDHFIVYFESDKDFAQKVLKKAEFYYDKIAKGLGYTRYSGFWTWGNKAKIYIYPDKDSFLKFSGAPEWSDGIAKYQEKTIVGHAETKNFIDSILPHEMTHLIFRDFVGFLGKIPLWVDEGVANWYTAEVKQGKIQKEAKDLLERNALMDVEDIFKIDDVNNVKKFVYAKKITTKDGREGLLIMQADQLVSLFYLQSASMIAFLRNKYGLKKFKFFCQELRDGKNVDEAMGSAYGVYLKGIDDFEKKWRNFLLEQ